MLVARTPSSLRDAILERRLGGASVGFVPTMGAIHDGQLSLVTRARQADGCVVVSCFVNASRFPQLDERSPAPRDERRDLALLEQAGCDIAFVPEAATLFPPGDATRIKVEGLTRQLEGASRPGHLDGLATVMLKLLHLVGPAHLYLGQRHGQQIVLVRHMMRDLFMNVELVVCPTVRDDDGLALSSANAQLSIEQRHAATCLYHALDAVRAEYDAGERSAEVLRARLTDVIAAEPMARVDYVSIADADTLAELQRVHRPALAMVAAWIGRTRLTDAIPLPMDAE